LNVTLRDGFWLGDGRIAEGEERRGVLSAVALVEVIAVERRRPTDRRVLLW
jgi:hypothetical protein